jgi:hypothetical protein
VEELVLGLHLARDELDVVHQHQVRLPVLDAEVVHGAAGADGLDEVVDKFVALDVEDTGGGGLAADLVGDGIEEVGLAQAGAAVDEEGVVAASGGVGHRPGGGAGQLVGGAHYEGVEGKFAAVHNGGGSGLLFVLALAEAVVVQEADGDV